MKRLLAIFFLIGLPALGQRFVDEVPNVAALKTRKIGNLDKSVFVRDFDVPGQGGGGLFVITNSSILVDGIFRIQSTDDANWSYDRRFSGPVDFRWGGAVGDGSPGDNTKIAAVLSAAASKGYAAFVSNLTGGNTTNQFMLSLIPSSLKINQKYLQIGGSGGLRIYTDSATNFIYAINGLAYTLPTVQGTPGSVLAQDGSGHVTWRQSIGLIGFDTNIFLLTGTNITINSGITLTNVTFVGGSSSNLLFGSGTSNTLPMWIGTHTLSNSPISLGTNYLRFAQPGGVVDTLRIADNATFPSDILKFLDGTGHWSVPITGSVGVTNAYNTIEDEGAALSQQTTINFVGDGVTATDSGSNTVVTILATTNAVNFYASNFFTTNITVVNLNVISNFFSTNVFTIQGDIITFLSTNTFLTNFFFNGTFITNIAAINPTDQYIPYRFDAQTFLDSPLKRLVGGIVNVEGPLSTTIRDVSGVNIDGGLGNEFSKELASNTTLGIINMSEGQQVSFTVTNTTFTLGFTNTLGAGVNELTWISGVVPAVDTNAVNIYHFWKSGGRIFASDPEQIANVNSAGIAQIGGGVGVVVKTNSTDFTTFNPLPVSYGGTGTNIFATLADGNIVFHKLSGDSLDSDDAQFLYSKSSRTLYLNRTVPTGQYQMLIAEGAGSVPQMTFYAAKVVELDSDLTVDVSPGFNFAGTLGSTNNFKFGPSSLTIYKNDGSTNFYVKSPSGYAGTGLKVLKDNGQYDNVTTGGTNVIVEQIGPFTPAFIPYATGTNTLGDSPLQRISSSVVAMSGSLTATTSFFTTNQGNATNPAIGLGGTLASPGGGMFRDPNGAISIAANTVDVAYFNTSSMRLNDAVPLLWSAGSPDAASVRFGFYHGSGSPEGVQAANIGSEYTDYSNGIIYVKQTGIGTTGWAAFSAGGGTTINPTDGYLPYRSSATTFANSPWFRLGSQRMGFADTNSFINVNTNASFGIGLAALGAMTDGLSGLTAIGPGAMFGVTGGQNSIAMGQNALFSTSATLQDVALGVGALQHDTSGDNNTAVGYNAGFNNNGGARNVDVGSNAGSANVTGNDDVIVGQNAQLSTTSGTNEIVIGSEATGNGSNTATIGNANVTSLYLGNTLVFPGGGGALAGTVLNTVAVSGLLAVDASKTNGIAATLAHMTNALLLTGSTATFLRSDGTQATPPGSNTTNLFANVIDLSENNLGTIAGAGTATISINTNLYRGIFSGSTFSVNLPMPPDSTNGYWAKITGTNTSGGTQIGTIKVATVTTALWREETKEATSTITNDTDSAFTMGFRVSNGTWQRVEASGDALTFPSSGGLSGTGEDNFDAIWSGGNLTQGAWYFISTNQLALGGTNTFLTIAGSINNLGLGENALENLTTGAGNLGIGRQAGQNLTDGGDNVILGYTALTKVSASKNIAIGRASLGTTGNSYSNSFVGWYSGNGNTTGNYNSGLGAEVLKNTTTSDSNSGLGARSGYDNLTGAYNTYLGAQAGYFDGNGTLTYTNTTQAGFGALATNNNSFALGNANVTRWQLGNNGPTIKKGTGSPESAQQGNVGDIWIRTDGGAGSTMYWKESGSASTGWAAKVPYARTISTTGPLAGGGDLSTDLTLTVSNATTAATGVIKLAGDLAGTATSPTLATNLKLATLGFTSDGGGSIIATGKRTGFAVCEYSATITGWSIVLDTGTATVNCWKIGSGNAHPTSSNLINTAGLGITSGTATNSTTVTDFTSTTVTAGDIFAFDLTACSAATELTFQLQLTK
jgi:hypothetical protein